jgi:RimJ/RimL family protein N-acetyltransferase
MISVLIMVIITGKDIDLKLLEETDAESLAKYANDKEISQFTLLPSPYTIDNANWFIRESNKKYQEKQSCELAIYHKENSEVIGVIGLTKLNFSEKNAELGYWLAKPYHGKKIMTQAVDLMINYGFTVLNLNSIYAKVMEPNIPSANLLEKKGFMLEKILDPTEDSKWFKAKWYILKNK